MHEAAHRRKVQNLHIAFTLAMAGMGAVLTSCAHETADVQADAAEIPRELPGLHNVFIVDEGVISGAQPEGDEGFDSLQRMGVRTIISVDGSLPEVEPAEARAMRYIHIPIQYSGMNDDEKIAIARAIREADGPVYFHCHHGKHRGPTATAYALESCGRMTPEEGLAFLEEAGTSHSYPGLFEVVASAEPVTTAEIAAAVREGRAELPSQARTSGFVENMVAIDTAFDHMKAIRDAGWKAPADHPDLAPAAEAGMLADHFKFLLQDPTIREEPEDLVAMMRSAHEHAQALENALVAGDMSAAAAAMEQVGANCNDCHKAYRNE